MGAYNMNATVFTQQVEAMSNRLTNLYQGINTSSSLSPALLPSALKELTIASERLELAVYGQTKVVDRLQSLLRLLKQEIGQPVANATRLLVRLTHEDLATACCTTRVTITRLLTQLQQQKKLSVDSQHHLMNEGMG